MPLLEFWRSNPKSVLSQNLKQVVISAGDGDLKDGSSCSQELRSFFSEVGSEHLARYARYCLETVFDNSGLVLQDLVNELGRRLDFNVEPGLYRGRHNRIGFDGIWRAPGALEVIVEVKTTDLYAINLEKLMGYRDKLRAQNLLSDSASLLLVVGRDDSGALEAQVRGSRFAWDIRIISVEALVKLVTVKEKSNDPATVQQIRGVIQPVEYTRVDRFVDLLFSTTEDVEQGDAGEVAAVLEGPDLESRQERTNTELLAAKRAEAVTALSGKLNTPLVKAARTLFWSPDKKTRACVAVSKNYESAYQPYWYAFHPAWRDFLAQGATAFFVLACMDRNKAYALPFDVVSENLKNLNATERSDSGKMYWHIALTTKKSGELAWNISRVGKHLPIEEFAVEWSSR